jgi:TRAP-type C4-dicarboxylate transport system permease small subunit
LIGRRRLTSAHEINGLRLGEQRMAPESNAATPQKPALVSRVMDTGLSYVVAVLLVAMSGTVFGNVVCRYFLNASLAWYEEVSRFLLIWIVFLGAVIAFIKGDHLGIDVIFMVLRPRYQRIVAVIADALVLVCLAVMFQGGWDMAIDSLESGWVASSVPIPYGWVYMVGPVSAALMFVQCLIKTLADIRALKGVLA